MIRPLRFRGNDACGPRVLAEDPTGYIVREREGYRHLIVTGTYQRLIVAGSVGTFLRCRYPNGDPAPDISAVAVVAVLPDA